MSDADRPSPESLLESLQRSEERKKRGKLRLFFGMCPGVGKTYAMLRAAQERRKEGADIVVGVVETHGRKETEALLQGLEVLPLARIPYKGTELREMNLDALLARRPQVALVDELAHSNSPGSRHPKRYLDVLELLNAGIDVYSTLNVQHLESRADAVEALAGVQVRERVPDSLVDLADEIEVIDISPAELRKRLLEGKVYLGQTAANAAQRFFRERNIVALREMALRSSAERVNRSLIDLLRIERQGEAPRTSERLLVAVGPSPYSERLIRWTRKFASAQAATWVAVTVEPQDPLDKDSRERIERNLALARKLGADVVATQGEDIADSVLRVGRRELVTQIVVGRSISSAFHRFIRGGTLTDRLIRNSSGIDVHVVSTPQEVRRIDWRRIATPNSAIAWKDIGKALIAVAVLTAIAYPLREFTGYWTTALFYFSLTILAGLTLSRGAVLLTGALSACIWNFFFIPPQFTFRIGHFQDALMFGLYFATALAMGHLTSRLRAAREAERAREVRSTALLRFLQTLTGGGPLSDNLAAALALVQEVVEGDVALALVQDGQSQSYPANAAFSAKERGVVDWVMKNREAAGRGSDSLPDLDAVYIPVSAEGESYGALRIRPRNGPRLPLATTDIVHAMCMQLARAIQREVLQNAAQRAQVLEASQRLQKTLLDGVSHELKTPLTVILMGVDHAQKALASSSAPDSAGSSLESVRSSAQRLLHTVNMLLDMTRFESGALNPKREVVDVGSVLAYISSRARTAPAGHSIEVDAADDLPLVWCDEGLLQEVLIQLLDNALTHTPEGTHVQLRAKQIGKLLRISVSDDGPGFGAIDPATLFEPFKRGDPRKSGGLGLGLSVAQRFAQAIGGTIRAEPIAPHGARFIVELPADEVDAPTE